MTQRRYTNTAFRKSILIFSLVSLFFILLSFFPSLVVLSILSALCSFVLHPLVRYLEFQIGMRRHLSILSVFVLCFLFIVVISISVLPTIVARLEALYVSFTSFQFGDVFASTVKTIAISLPFLNESTILERVHSFLSSIQEEGVILFEKAFSFLPMLILVPFVTYFILADGDRLLKHTIELVPNKYFEMTLNVLYKIRIDLIGYFKGWLLDSFIVGIISILGYWIIGIDFAILLGVIAGIANLIPYVGPIAGILPAALVSVTQHGDLRMLPDILLLTVIVQLIDNVIVQPYCFSKTVDMHPVTVIIVLLLGNSLMGVVGMLLAIPIATILKASFIQTYWGLKHYRITD